MDRKEHEPRKLFVGGLPRWGLTHAHLRAHFARYGHVVEALVMAFPDGMGRGFGFVEFQDEAAVLRALDSAERDRHNDFFGRKVEVKRAEKKTESRSAQTQGTMCNKNAELKKIFVGGLRDHITKEDLVDYFKKFGEITDVIVMADKVTRKPRGFGFVTFDCEDATDKALNQRFHYLNGTKVEIKNAEPRGCKSNPANSYDGLYSPNNIPYLLPYPYFYPYPYIPYPIPHGIHPMNQMGTSDDVIYGSDSKLGRIKGNQQRVVIPSSNGLKSDHLKTDSNTHLMNQKGTSDDVIHESDNKLGTSDTHLMNQKGTSDDVIHESDNKLGTSDTHLMNQKGTSDDVIHENDNKLGCIKGNQQRVVIPSSNGLKSDPVKTDSNNLLVSTPLSPAD
ncbi:hypothetical protein U9M48_010679 [Paspalum notatum var. saurae]|uniref:RRM domain-containing protein n=1 Tax=Paspalum notatum var. saurae TaxID=547442 RepID=A0AAQ3SVB8_PASNO